MERGALLSTIPADKASGDYREQEEAQRDKTVE
jgi:hypothetical protein